MKKVGKTTRPFRNDLNQIPYDYTVEGSNRLDLIDGVPDELWNEVHDIVQETGIKTIPMENKSKKAIMRNAGLEEAQAGIKIAGRNINNLRYVDNTTLMAESEEELKSLLMKFKEESKNFGLKLNIQKTKIMASGPITSQQIDGKTMETVTLFSWAPNHCRW